MPGASVNAPGILFCFIVLPFADAKRVSAFASDPTA